MKAIKNEFENGTTYIGASAGALIAGKDIKLAADFDKNDVRLKEDEMEEIFKYYDTHAHYGEFGLGCNKKYRRFYEDTNQLLENARKAGVVKIVNVAIGIDSNEGILSVLENAGEIPEIRFAFGEHPNSVGTEADCGLDAQKDALIEKFLEHEKACAVKTGLDLYKGKDNQFRQRERFLTRIQQSIKHGLPLLYRYSRSCTCLCSAWFFYWNRREGNLSRK